MTNPLDELKRYLELSEYVEFTDSKGRLLHSIKSEKLLVQFLAHEQLQRRFEEALEVIKVIDLNFKKITKCPDNTCDGCHEDAKIAAEYSSKFLRSLDKEK